MLEQFSDPARRVVTIAEEEADRMGHPHVGTEHLLLGLLAEEGTPAAALLAAAGATLVAARGKVIEAVGPSESAPGLGQLLRTARAQRALDRASRFSRVRGAQWVEPDDLLAGVLDVEGRAGQVLRGLGVDVVALGESVKRGRSAPGAVVAATPAGRARAGAPAGRARAVAPDAPTGAADPRCPHCHAGLSGGLSHRLLVSRDAAGQERTFVVAYCSACGGTLGATPA
jgi:ATP-dependent Clp protease ATP-binding subunit ClpA